MATDTTPASDSGQPSFSTRSLEQTFPDELRDDQKEWIATAVRNPYASVQTVTDELGIGATSLVNAILALSVGGYKPSDEIHEYDSRLDRGPSWFTDLTIKQRACVDFAARHPGAFDEFTYSELLGVVIEETGVVTHVTYIRNYTTEHPDMVARRREWYERTDPDEIVPGSEMSDSVGSGLSVDPDEIDGVDPADVTPLMRQLAGAGVEHFPDSNLDGYPTHYATKYGDRSNIGRHDSSGGSSASTGGDTETADGDTVQASVGDTASAGDSAAAGDDDERVTRSAGNSSYQGPASGLDMTGGAREPSLLHVTEGSDAIGDELSEAFAEAREEEGTFGEDAFKRDLDINDKEDLEIEIRRLRMLVSMQGSMLEALSDTLENLTVSVSFDAPDENSG